MVELQRNSSEDAPETRELFVNYDKYLMYDSADRVLQRYGATAGILKAENVPDPMKLRGPRVRVTLAADSVVGLLAESAFKHLETYKNILTVDVWNSTKDAVLAVGAELLLNQSLNKETQKK